MHLISCGDLENLRLEEFSVEKIPPYAILSHTWGNEEEEATFKELPTQLASDEVRVKEGLTKIAGACSQASKDGYRYLWVDTCCIDKTNHAELSESINSMFYWYKQAEECYVYLSDVLDGESQDAILNSR